MSEMPPGPSAELPDVDERLVAPDSRFEIIDGKVSYVPPALEPHGTSHARLAAIVEAHRHPDFSVAVDMLTRTSRVDDIAPDVSVYPSARNPRTGGRQLEQLAFEIASTESLSHAADKARRLVGRGVRRVFALDLDRERVLEWSTDIDAWSILDLTSEIDDPALAVPLPVAPLIDAARADDAVVRAFRARRHPEFLAERAEGERIGREQGRLEALADLVVSTLATRGMTVTPDQTACVFAERDVGRLMRWAQAASTIADVASLLALP
jgi:Uma2 family endonuclease